MDAKNKQVFGAVLFSDKMNEMIRKALANDPYPDRSIAKETRDLLYCIIHRQLSDLFEYSDIVYLMKIYRTYELEEQIDINKLYKMFAEEVAFAG